MNVDDARSLLRDSHPDDGPVGLPPSVLSQLTVDDLPPGVEIHVGTMKQGVLYFEWNGSLRRDGKRIVAVADLTWTRKQWYEPLGLEQYLDLVRRAVEVRQQIRGDVKLVHHDDDGVFIHLSYSIFTNETNVGLAFDLARKVSNELEEAAHQAVDEIGKQIAEVAARVSGWGSKPLDVLVESVATAKDSDAKGRSLEELCSRLFEAIPGLKVTGRIRTATEEIDISILNDSDDPRLRREAAIMLAECKNWSTKCGKNEFVIFREKMENRNRRCSLGFLISCSRLELRAVKKLMLNWTRCQPSTP